jgi:hypothetical protein
MNYSYLAYSYLNPRSRPNVFSPSYIGSLLNPPSRNCKLAAGVSLASQRLLAL